VHEKQETPQTLWPAAFLNLPRLDSNPGQREPKEQGYDFFLSRMMPGKTCAFLEKHAVFLEMIIAGQCNFGVFGQKSIL
jgi:hypothetical protein